MFMLITIIMVWAIVIMDTSLLQQALPAHSFETLAIFWPLAQQGWVSLLLWTFWALWIFAFALFFVNMLIVGPNSGAPMRRHEIALITLGSPGNMKRFDTVLILLALAIALLGWTEGWAMPLLIGSIVTLGLLLNKAEQALT